MTKFYCTTCCKLFDDKEIKWYDNSQVCERCYNKHIELTKKEVIE